MRSGYEDGTTIYESDKIILDRLTGNGYVSRKKILELMAAAREDEAHRSGKYYKCDCDKVDDGLVSALKSKLNIATRALNDILKTGGFDGDTFNPIAVARKAKFNMKYLDLHSKKKGT